MPAGGAAAYFPGRLCGITEFPRPERGDCPEQRPGKGWPMKRSDVTGNEVFFDPRTFIVSKSDPRGIITQVNATLLEVTGYREDELLGSQHNILRHPDMPRGIFELMWETLRSGDAFYGFMKNRCKNGDHYWAFAYVKPEHRGGELLGYRSFRRVPQREMVELWAGHYQRMRALEEKTPTRDQCRVSRQWLNKWLRKQGVPDYKSWMLRSL